MSDWWGNLLIQTDVKGGAMERSIGAKDGVARGSIVLTIETRGRLPVQFA